MCCAGSRLLVQEGIADAFIAKVKARMSRLRVGSPLDKNTDIGPLVDRTQLDRVRGLVAEGAKQGAECWQPDFALPSSGYFYLPTLATGVSPANILAQEEVFGPVLATMTFRTTEEAIELANNTRYGLAASVWSENLNIALYAAPQLKAGVVWVNGTNMFDAACGFGGYRESGFGREGGREGMYEYLAEAAAARPGHQTGGRHAARRRSRRKPAPVDRPHSQAVHRRQAGPARRQLFLRGGRQKRRVSSARQDWATARIFATPFPPPAPARAWPEATTYNRSQVLYFLAENLSIRADEFAARLVALTGASAKAARAEVDLSVERLFGFAGMADKFEGRVHQPPARAVTLALHEPVGVLAIVAPDEAPLLGFISLIAPALAMGNAVVAVPSQKYPLLATDLYQVIEASDVPPGAINIVSGKTAELAGVLAKHDDVDGLWIIADTETCKAAEAELIGNLKRVWTAKGHTLDWQAEQFSGDYFLRRAIEVKNVWVPYGD